MIRWALRRAIDGSERDGDSHASHTSHIIDASPRPGWGYSRVTDLLAAAVIAGYGLAAPAAAQVSPQPAATVYTMTPERIAASTAVLVGLIGAVTGGLALARSAGRIGNGTGRRGAIVALALGPVGLAIGALVVATADGGLGTGNGLGGGVVAMIVGLIGVTLGGLALARSRRAGLTPRGEFRH